MIKTKGLFISKLFCSSLQIEERTIFFKNNLDKRYDLEDDFLELLTIPKMFERYLVDGQLLHNILEEINPDSQRNNKSFRDRTVLQRYSDKDYIFPKKSAPKALEDQSEECDHNEFPSTSGSGLIPFFSSEHSDEIWDTIFSILQEKLDRNGSKIFINEIFALSSQFLDLKCFTSTQHKNFSTSVNLI